MILENDFDPSVLKALIETLSLYPPGSYITLNTGEIGRILGTNPGLPTRPRHKLVATEKGMRPTESRRINLAVSPVLYIVDAVDETKINLADKRLSLELRAQRWWVKGL